MTAPTEHSAIFDPGDKVTIAASGDVIAGSAVTTSGAIAGDASGDIAGIADTSCKAGGQFGVYRVGIHEGIASGAITKGDPLCAAPPASTGQPGRFRRWVSGTDPVAARIARAWSTAASGAPVTYALIGV